MPATTKTAGVDISVVSSAVAASAPHAARLSGMRRTRSAHHTSSMAASASSA